MKFTSLEQVLPWANIAGVDMLDTLCKLIGAFQLLPSGSVNPCTLMIFTAVHGHS